MADTYPTIDAPYVIETQHGIYPIGRWGFRGSRPTKDSAISDCLNDERVIDNKTGEVIWPENREGGMEKQGQRITATLQSTFISVGDRFTVAGVEYEVGSVKKTGEGVEVTGCRVDDTPKPQQTTKNRPIWGEHQRRDA